MQVLAWNNGVFAFLDQTLLPHEERIRETRDYLVVAEAIRSLRIRGAPAIGIAAAYGAALSIFSPSQTGLASARVALEESLRVLAGTRPTAVNLFHALDRVRRAADEASDLSLESLRQAVIAEARAIHREEMDACAAIAAHGAALLPDGCSVLTHCNAGALATGGVGTALGVIAEAHRQGKVKRVFADETRPLLQGSRLTAWELLRAGIPVSVLTDSSAGSLLAAGIVQAVVVGADRIALNGDVANKVGTYPLAVLARRHGVPVYVAAPLSTVDRRIASGQEIPIEQRDASEVLEIGGKRLAPHGAEAYAPAFDVTPNELVSAIVTEGGAFRPPFRELGAPAEGERQTGTRRG
jgi:methylthioribose-1-phosphate isomerase